MRFENPDRGAGQYWYYCPTCGKTWTSADTSWTSHEHEVRRVLGSVKAVWLPHDGVFDLRHLGDDEALMRGEHDGEGWVI